MLGAFFAIFGSSLSVLRSDSPPRVLGDPSDLDKASTRLIHAPPQATTTHSHHQAINDDHHSSLTIDRSGDAASPSSLTMGGMGLAATFHLNRCNGANEEHNVASHRPSSSKTIDNEGDGGSAEFDDDELKASMMREGDVTALKTHIYDTVTIDGVAWRNDANGRGAGHQEGEDDVQRVDGDKAATATEGDGSARKGSVRRPPRAAPQTWISWQSQHSRLASCWAAVGRVLGRTRKRAELRVDLLLNRGVDAPAEALNQQQAEMVASGPVARRWRTWLTDVMLPVLAPSWRLETIAAQPVAAEATTSKSPRRFRVTATLSRRADLFVFAITGGHDRRATFVERTWGRRTPIQWYGDAWDAAIRPIVVPHQLYLKDKFKYLVFKISKIWWHVYCHFSEQPSSSAASPTGANRRRLDHDGQAAPSSFHLPSKRRRMTILSNGSVVFQHSQSLSDDRSSSVGSAEPSRRGGLLNAAHASSTQPLPSGLGYDWYVRLWDDNYFLEENFLLASHMMRPRVQPVMLGKIGYRYMADTAIFPFAGGGAGWFLSHRGMQVIGPTMITEEAEDWYVKFRSRKDIFLPHDLHDEDVFLTAWFHLMNIHFVNIPGVEHVSPGMNNRQRCLSDQTLYDLRWTPNETIFFDYPAKKPPKFSIDGQWYAYGKPIVWHYMSPSRLLKLEALLYPHRRTALDRLVLEHLPGRVVPQTASDKVNPRKRCYPGVPDDGKLPPRGLSVYERQPPPQDAVVDMA